MAEIEGKIPDISNLSTKTALTAVENKIPGVTNSATKTALTTVENRIHDVSSLVKKTDYNTGVVEIDNKVSILDGKINENKTKSWSIKNNLKRAIKNLLHIFLGNVFFDRGDGSQAYLIFQPLHRYVQVIANT